MWKCQQEASSCLNPISISVKTNVFVLYCFVVAQLTFGIMSFFGFMSLSIINLDLTMVRY